MRIPFIAGNWKMNTTPDEASLLSRAIVERVSDVRGVEIAVCPPFIDLPAVHEVVAGTVVGLGAQNMHWEENGAYTGEISPNMLLTLGCRYVILGHSERRLYFRETDDMIARKIRAAITANLIPIVCVGETKEEREDGVTRRVVDEQIRGAFEDLTADEFMGTVIAYEPVWAIGTGLTATEEQAQEVHAFIRELIGDLFGREAAVQTRIQYGGSMKPENASGLLAQLDIDGGLIGGVALKAESFESIIRAAIT